MKDKRKVFIIGDMKNETPIEELPVKETPVKSISNELSNVVEGLLAGEYIIAEDLSESDIKEISNTIIEQMKIKINQPQLANVLKCTLSNNSDVHNSIFLVRQLVINEKIRMAILVMQEWIFFSKKYKQYIV